MGYDFEMTCCTCPCVCTCVLVCVCVSLCVYACEKTMMTLCPCVCMCVLMCVCVWEDDDDIDTGCRRVIKCLKFIGHFPQKSPIIRGSFAKNDLQLKEPTCPCVCMRVRRQWWHWYRVAKTHMMPCLYRSFSAKEPYYEWLFCEKWPAT